MLGAENVDAGALLSRLQLARNVRLQAASVQFLFDGRGQSLPELVYNTRGEAHIRSLLWQGTAGVAETPYSVELSQLDLDPQEGFVLSRVNGDWDVDLPWTTVLTWLGEPSLGG